MLEPSKLFISYRRKDSEAIARSLCEKLRSRFGPERIFFDTSDIPYGEDFREVIRQRIASCDVVLPVIGPYWLSARDSKGRRLDQADDPVRFEIETALSLGKRIMPIRVDGAPALASAELPTTLLALAPLNAPELRLASFDIDVEEIMRQLLGEARITVGALERIIAALKGGPLVGGALVLILGVAGFTGLINAFGLETGAERLLLAAAPRAEGEPVVLVGIDAASEKALGRNYGDSRAGWRRDHARLVDAAQRAGARAVVFDLFLSPPKVTGSTAAEQEAASAIAAADQELASAARRAQQSVPPTRVVFGARELEGVAPRLSTPLREAAHWGSLCLYPLHDGAIWSVALAVLRPAIGRSKDTTAVDTPALALTAFVHEDLLEADESARELRFAGRTPAVPVRYSTVERQRDEQECAVTHAGEDLLLMRLRPADAGYWLSPQRYLSYGDLLAPDFAAGERLKGKVVLVGVTAIGGARHPDRQRVADGLQRRTVFGVELQAEAIRALATGDVPRLPTLDDQVLASLAACVLGGTVAVRMYDAPAWRRRAVLMAVILLWWSVAWWLARSNLLLRLVNDTLAIVLAANALRVLQTIAWRYRAFRRIAA